ncbi:ABC transporter substrate-binding protein [Sporolituus thermophilus]|uniref:Putative ABC transport system substrate-binding protein n=1 Tax=Sporolituus thermophilus DSM 23256 TaxID=1123285 RepID=A0A1G7KZV9_9FIRM|nr:ABC transporter substrate-binding protein [Sporolituus thermophilus]SDF42289.1 putative ABC transport system substrate-binding protein [Sporolituus thermophilus DSM 23256]
MRIFAWFGLAATVIIMMVFYFAGQGASANQPKKIGVLVASDLRLPKLEGLRVGLPHYGFVEGKDVSIIVKNAGNNVSLLPKLAKELVTDKVDVIVTTGTFETFAAKEATEAVQVPVVFVGVGCSVEMGIVKDTVNPGCNVTGVDSHYVQLSGKRLEYLKRLVPEIRQVLVLYNPHSTPIGPSAAYLYEAAEKFNVTMKLISVTTSQEVMAALEKEKGWTDGVLLMCSLLFEAMSECLADWSIAEKIPVMGVSEQQTQKGLLASYGLPYKEEGRQAARIVSNILRNQEPANIPVESPARLEFHLNTRTAKKLGIQINHSTLPFVTKYIE